MADRKPKQKVNKTYNHRRGRGRRAGRYFLASYAFTQISNIGQIHEESQNVRRVTRSMNFREEMNSVPAPALSPEHAHMLSQVCQGQPSHMRTEASEGFKANKVNNDDLSQLTAREGKNIPARDSSTCNLSPVRPENSTPSQFNRKEKDSEQHPLIEKDANPPLSGVEQATPGTSHSPSEFREQVKDLGSCINQLPTEVGELIMKTLSSMDLRLKKLDKLESMSEGLRSDIGNINNKIGTLSNQMLGTQSDLKKIEKKCEQESADLKGRMQKVEKGCQKIESAWKECQIALHKDLNVVQDSEKTNSSKITELANRLTEIEKIKDNLSDIQNKIESAAEDKFQVLQKALKQEVKKEMQDEIDTKQKKQEARQAYDKMKNQAYSRRYNLLLFGIQENASSEQDYKSVTDFFLQRMNVKNPGMESLYRLGAPNTNRPRPIVVEFSDIKERWDIWKKRGTIVFDPQNPVWIQEDLPRKLRQDNRVLLRILKTAKSLPDFSHDIKIQDFQILLDGVNYGMDELHRLPREISTKMAFTPYSDDVVAFFTKYSPLSNHFPSSFVVDNITYNCVEQFLAVQRAFLARNKSLARRAMGTNNPADHKNILNLLRKDQPDAWKETSKSVIITALRAKFTQNKNLADFLMDTYPRKIGEASKNETWGIGLSIDSNDVLDYNKWQKGGNLLGTSLEQVRAELLASRYTKHSQETPETKKMAEKQSVPSPS